MFGSVDYPFGCEAFEGSDKSSDVSISRINYQMKVVRHKNIRCNLAGPIKQQIRTHVEKCCTGFLLFENGETVQDVAGNVMQGTGKVRIGPFLSHEGAREQARLALEDIA